MQRWFPVVVALVLIVSTASAQSRTASATLIDLGGAVGITGAAAITETGTGTTRIVLRLSGVQDGVNYPSHIHPGTYINGKFDFDPKPVYDLKDAVAGVSDTTLPVPFADFVARDYLVATHLPTGTGQGAGVDLAGRAYGAAVAAGPVQEVAGTLPATGGGSRLLTLLLSGAAILVLLGVALVWQERRLGDVPR